MKKKAKCIALSSFKGGTAKTSVALNLGSALCRFYKKKVLLIDFDAQANLTTGLGYDPDEHDSMASVPSPEPFSPYYYVAPDDQVQTADLAADNYRYWEKDWYAAAAASGQAQWSEPYVDEGGGEARMVTFSVPFFHTVNDERELRGVATADVSLQWLNEQVRGITVGETGYGIILSKEGYIVSHPDASLMEQTESALDMESRDRPPEVEQIVTFEKR